MYIWIALLGDFLIKSLNPQGKDFSLEWDTIGIQLTTSQGTIFGDALLLAVGSRARAAIAPGPAA